jgi:hypothetical protein
MKAKRMKRRQNKRNESERIVKQRRTKINPNRTKQSETRRTSPLCLFPGGESFDIFFDFQIGGWGFRGAWRLGISVGDWKSFAGDSPGIPNHIRSVIDSEWELFAGDSPGIPNHIRSVIDSDWGLFAGDSPGIPNHIRSVIDSEWELCAGDSPGIPNHIQSVIDSEWELFAGDSPGIPNHTNQYSTDTVKTISQAAQPTNGPIDMSTGSRSNFLICFCASILYTRIVLILNTCHQLK